MPLPEKLLMEPPLALTSSTVKSVEASDKVNVMVAVSPTPSSSLFVVIATVGGVVSLVSTVMETEPALVLALPAQEDVLFVTLHNVCRAERQELNFAASVAKQGGCGVL